MPNVKKKPDRALDMSVTDEQLNEAEYLRRMSERAKLAIMGAAGAIKTDATDAAKSGVSAATALNPLHIVEKRPFISLGVSAAIGFIGVFFFNPNRYSRVRKRLAKLERKFRDRDKDVVEVRARSTGDTGEKAAAAGLGAVILDQALKVAKPFVMSQLGPLIAGLQERVGQQQSNGRHTESAAESLDPSL